MRMGNELIDPSGAAHGSRSRCVKLGARENEVKDAWTHRGTPRRTPADATTAPVTQKRPVMFRHEDEG